MGVGENDESVSLWKSAGAILHVHYTAPIGKFLMSSRLREKTHQNRRVCHCVSLPVHSLTAVHHMTWYPRLMRINEDDKSL